MNKFEQLKKVKELHASGENIIAFLKSLEGSEKNSIDDILISYDFQSGSYIRNFSENRDLKYKYSSAIADVINQLGDFDSIMEVGVGEATTYADVVANLNHRPSKLLGFDISWSRIKFAKGFLGDHGIKDVSLFTANLYSVPLEDNAVDVVYTSHSLEPNGGEEEAALRELFRITNKYLVLLEPAYELASEEAKQRMRTHGYVKGLKSTAEKLGYPVIAYRLFDYATNPMNPTGLLILKKDESKSSKEAIELRCPITHAELKPYNDQFLFAESCGLAYPVLDGVPCLLKENAILATHLLTDYEDFKRVNNITV